jgi:hypothetical protein
MHHLQFTLQANDLVVKSLSAQSFTFELLDRFPQRMNLGGPAILVRCLPGLRTLCSCQRAIAFLDGGNPAQLGILQLLFEFSEDGCITHGFPHSAARRSEAARLADHAVALAHDGAQGARSDLLTRAAHGFNGLLDLLVAQFLVQVSGIQYRRQEVHVPLECGHNAMQANVSRGLR